MSAPPQLGNTSGSGQYPSDVIETKQALRVTVRGKFFFDGEQKLYVKGVTYGTFRPDDEGHEYPSPAVVERDFRQMAVNGINAVRTYTVPPIWLLDAALRCGLRVFVGLGAERHIGYLAEKKNAPHISSIVRQQVRDLAAHPAILCYAIGNEIPASSVRWLGPRRIELYLRELYDVIKKEDPDGLVTYVNYPSTEYLRLPFLDLLSWNVYLESPEQFAAYLARLQNLAGDHPLLMSEIGLDSMRNGTAKQADVLVWQIRSSFQQGSAGAFVYSWTDEWFRGGAEVDDWAFGITDKSRCPKPALRAVRHAYRSVPFAPADQWPFISVVVCTYNGSRTIHQTLEGLQRLEYPNYEVIVVDDGSTDTTPAILAGCGARVIRIQNGGLSNARNVGMRAATGEIVAYIDDDAYPDPHWLSYLAAAYRDGTYAAVGGPNIAPEGDGPIADCVANAPGGPIHVLLSDTEAEHIPGCNCSFRREALLALGGFDPQFRIAGDDVDLCWRVQERGWRIGFSPAAVVWHHRRNSFLAYWRQQLNYGKAEALLERKWPDKYNAAGHVSWGGRVYGPEFARILGNGRIYHGVWGSAPFQLLYEREPGLLSWLPLMPEWYLLLALVAGFCALSHFWRPLDFAIALMAPLSLTTVFQAAGGAARARFPGRLPSASRFGRGALTLLLFLLQPLARLVGRFGYGLTFHRRSLPAGLCFPRIRTFAGMSELWRDPLERLKSLEENLRGRRLFVSAGGDYDGWDLQARIGLMGAARLIVAVEELGGGIQMIRVRAWPRFSIVVSIAVAALAALTLAAALDRAAIAAFALAIATGLLAGRALWETMGALAAVAASVREATDPEQR
jgi:O-antigen biosynthesis protein